MNLPATGKRNSGIKMLLSTASIFIVIAGLRAGGTFLVPIVIGLFLALLSLPMTGWLRSHSIPSTLAVVMTITFEALILTGVIIFIVAIMPDFAKYSENLRGQVVERVGEFQETLDGWAADFQKMFDPDSDAKPTSDAEPEDSVQPEPEAAPAVAAVDPNLATTGNPPPAAFNIEGVVDKFFNSMIVGGTGALQWAATLLAKTFVCFIIMIFVLVESGRYGRKLAAMGNVKGPSFEGFKNAGVDLQRYLGIKTAISCLTGLLGWLSCVLFGVEFPVIWGLLAFLLNYIPTFGSIAAGIFPTFVALIQLGLGPAAGVAFCFIGINALLGSFIEPVLLGNRFGLSTVMVLVSVLFWGWVWGPVGMFLAVPLTMMLKIMMDQSDDFRWLALLISKDIPDEDKEELELAEARAKAQAEESPSIST
jgi:AI-2 transport protein TqsA